MIVSQHSRTLISHFFSLIIFVFYILQLFTLNDLFVVKNCSNGSVLFPDFFISDLIAYMICLFVLWSCVIDYTQSLRSLILQFC